MRKARKFRDRLSEDLKNKKFKEAFEYESQALELAIKIARLREKKKISQKKLAQIMDSSQQAISRLENGNYRGYTLKTLEKLAYAFGKKLIINFR